MIRIWITSLFTYDINAFLLLFHILFPSKIHAYFTYFIKHIWNNCEAKDKVYFAFFLSIFCTSGYSLIASSKSVFDNKNSWENPLERTSAVRLLPPASANKLCTSGHRQFLTLRTCQAIGSNTNFAVNTVFTRSYRYCVHVCDTYTRYRHARVNTA